MVLCQPSFFTHPSAVDFIKHESEAELSWTKAVGINLAQCRQNIGLSVRQLSRLTGISPSHLLRIESGEFDFTVTKLLRLCESLGVPVSLVAEQALFVTRGTNEIIGNARGEKAFQSYTEASPEKDDDLAGLILLQTRCVMAMHLSANPTLLMELSIGFKPAEVRLRLFAEKLDLQSSPVERLFAIQALIHRPMAKLISWGLVDDELIKDFFVWTEHNTLNEHPLPFEIPFLKISQGKDRILSLNENSLKSNFKPVPLSLDNLINRLVKATAAPGAKKLLADHLKVAPARVTEWLQRRKEPGGSTAFELLNWVDSWENNNKKNSGSATNTTRAKTRKKKSRHENLKSDPM